MPAPGPKKSVVAPHRKADGQGEQGEAERGDLAGAVLRPEVPLQKEKDGHHRNDGQHDVIEELIRQDEVQLGSRPGPRQGSGRAPGGAGHPDLSPAPEAVGGEQGAPHIAALVGGGGGVGVQSGQQISGEGDQPAAAGHGVHDAPQEHQGTHDQQDVQQVIPFH